MTTDMITITILVLQSISAIAAIVALVAVLCSRFYIAKAQAAVAASRREKTQIDMLGTIDERIAGTNPSWWDA